MPRRIRARAFRPPAEPEWLRKFLATGEEPGLGTDEAFECWLYKAGLHKDHPNPKAPSAA